MRLFILGDTHGNTDWLRDYVFPTAAKLNPFGIIQLGDFGAWEHTDSGIEYMDAVAALTEQYLIPVFWLHGNHDKHSLVLDWYGEDRNPDGFIRCRPGVYYIPQGHTWVWEGVKFRVFGGAYSVDKEWRLETERERYRKALNVEGYRRQAGRPPLDIEPTFETLWFPEEEMTDVEFAKLMEADSSKVDVIFSHDKPRGANLGPHFNLKDLPECMPNQDRLQRALVAHQPDWWFHGHFHHRYETMVRNGDDDAFTRVVGLSCDPDGAPRFWRPTHSWSVLDIHPGPSIVVTSGSFAVDKWIETEEDDGSDAGAVVA